jgi:hypothetical protein
MTKCGVTMDAQHIIDILPLYPNGDVLPRQPM